MGESQPLFVCHNCAYRTRIVHLAERHEDRTGHDVWEEVTDA